MFCQSTIGLQEDRALLLRALEQEKKIKMGWLEKLKLSF